MPSLGRVELAQFENKFLLEQQQRIKTSPWLEEKLEKTPGNPNKRPSPGLPGLGFSSPLEGKLYFWSQLRNKTDKSSTF